MEEKKEEKQAACAEGSGEPKEELRRQLEECQKLKDEYLAGWQRARADMLNYKKEEMERVGDFLGYAKTEFILNLLPVLDNFEIAESNLTENLKKDDNVKGLLMIKNQLEEFLKNQGLEEIKAMGEKFDPNFHEVLEEVGEDNPLQAKEPGAIVEEVQKGYKINGRLLRPAKVKVAK